MHIFDLIIIVAGGCGFFIAAYIGYKKRKKKPLVCPLRSKCGLVISSDFSHFFGVPVEYLGLAYYAIVIVGHLVLALVPAFVTPLTIFISLIFSTIAFLFSIYLISIQAFVLKEWCAWCLASAFLSTIIFCFTLASSPFSLLLLLSEHTRIFTIIHLFGMALGIGAATFTDIFFFRFLKDFKISEEEASTLKVFSEVIWFALGILVLSGLGLFFPKSETLLESGKFLVKMLGILVLIANGFLLNLIVQPRLAKITFGASHDHHEGELHRLRKFSFALGAISITSWYFIFVLGALRGAVIPFLPLFLGYIGLLALAILGSQVFDYVFSHQKHDEQPKP